MLAVLPSSGLDPLPHPQRSTRQRFNPHKALLLLQKCHTSFKHLKQIHAHIIRNGLAHDPVLVTKLISLSSSHTIDYSTLIFNQIHSPTTFTCNITIRSCTNNAAPRRALLLYLLMLRRGIPPDKFTFPFVLKACTAVDSPAAETGRAVHSLAVKTGFSTDIYLQNTLMDLYLKLGRLECGRAVFDKMRVRNVVSWTTMVAGLAASGELETAGEVFEAMPVRNVVSWTAMINGYVRNGMAHRAFELFRRMQIEGVTPNEFTLVCLLPACTELGSLSLGRWIHEFACENGCEMSVFLGTALIDMYSKCGSVEDAVKVFEEMPDRSVATWNSMITSLGMHGHGHEAIALFTEMGKTNIRPDAITFVGVLCACVNACMVHEGLEFFKVMTELWNIVPSFEHYRYIFELLGRAGMWHDAYELAENITRIRKLDDVCVWRALLRVCETHGNAELGKVANKRIVELHSLDDSMPPSQTQLQHHYFEREVE